MAMQEPRATIPGTPLHQIRMRILSLPTVDTRNSHSHLTCGTTSSRQPTVLGPQDNSTSNRATPLKRPTPIRRPHINCRGSQVHHTHQRLPLMAHHSSNDGHLLHNTPRNYRRSTRHHRRHHSTHHLSPRYQTTRTRHTTTATSPKPSSPHHQHSSRPPQRLKSPKHLRLIPPSLHSNSPHNRPQNYTNACLNSSNINRRRKRNLNCNSNSNSRHQHTTSNSNNHSRSNSGRKHLRRRRAMDRKLSRWRRNISRRRRKWRRR